MVVRIRTLLIFGFGGLLFSALGITLFLGFYSATANTFSLLQDKALSMINGTILMVDQELKPVETQAKWIVTAFRNKAISLDEPDKLEAFLVGSIGTTPDVDAIFIATPDGRGFQVRQSTRNLSEVDISGNAGAMAAVERTKAYSAPKWEEPIWLDELSDAAINLRTPLIVDGTYIGMLAQINTVSVLSKTLSRKSASMGGDIPFILYDGKYVLAHPSLTNKNYGGSEENPLPTVDGFSDNILAQIDSITVYENTRRYSLGDAVSGELEVEGDRYFFLYKSIEGYADKPLTIGSYFRMEAIEDEIKLLFGNLAIALLVMVASIGAAIWLSRCISKPVASFQRAVQSVDKEAYDDVPFIEKGSLLEFNNAAVSFNNMVEGLREKKIIQDLFGRVVPSAVAEQMLKNPDGLKPQKLTATVLFSDLAKFTSISEKLQPEEIVELLNEYFSVMTEIIRDHGGIVTQFQGDAVLAVFNVPVEDTDHAMNAINSAREMQEAMKKMTIFGHEIRCRIGVNTGLLVAGNVGAEKRMNYTVHGDAVNIAARLEQLNKEYGTTVLVSESTVEMAGRDDMKSLGAVTVRGKSHPVEIYTFNEE